MGCGASKSVEPTKQVGAGGGGSSTKSTTTVDSAVPPHSLGAAVDPGVGGGSQTSRPRDPDIPAVPKSNPPAAEERASKAREAAGDANDVEQREEAPRSNGNVARKGQAEQSGAVVGSSSATEPADEVSALRQTDFVDHDVEKEVSAMDESSRAKFAAKGGGVVGALDLPAGQEVPSLREIEAEKQRIAKRKEMEELQRKERLRQQEEEQQAAAERAAALERERREMEAKRREDEVARKAKFEAEMEAQRLRVQEEEALAHERRRAAEDAERKKRDLSIKLLRMKEAEERAKMEAEENRSRLRAEKEAEIERIQQSQYEKLRQEEEEKVARELEAEAREQDLANLENPDLLSFFVVFSGDVATQRYRFHLPFTRCHLSDLKLCISAEFGFAPDQQAYYYKFQPLSSDVDLSSLPGFSTNSSLSMFAMGIPANPPARITRPLHPEGTVQAAKNMNCQSAAGEDDILPQYRNWADETLLLSQHPKSTTQERLDADRKYQALFADFLKAAEAGVDLILHGKALPVENMSSYGSGGERFVVGGLLFRKAWNWEIIGQNVGEGDSAFKVCGHELRALRFFRDKVESLGVPLCATVESYGNRFLVQSLSPIDSQSLVYGSSTDGLLVEQSDPVAEDCAATIAKTANLKPHSVLERLSGRKTKKPHLLPFTAELHRREDDYTCYPASFGRIFPPDLSGDSTEPIDWLTRLLRPELVVSYGAHLSRDGADDVGSSSSGDEDQPADKRIPLNPDAPLMALLGVEGSTEDVEELKRAAAYLQDIIIPRLINDLNTQECEVLTGDELTEEMHSRGINLRYLGRIAKECTLNHVRELGVREIIARVTKTLIRDDLSFLSEFTEENAIATFVTYFNSIFGSELNENTERVWSFIQDLSLKKFDFELEDSIKNKLYMPGLLRNLSSKLGVTMESMTDFNFSEAAPIAPENILSIKPIVKPGRTETAPSVDALLEAARNMDALGKRSKWYLEGGPERAEATEMYRECVAAAEQVYGHSDLRTADVFLEFAEHLDSRHVEHGRPERSRWNKAAFVPEDLLSVEARSYYRKGTAIRELHPQAATTLETARMYMAMARLQKPEVQYTPLSPACTAPPTTSCNNLTSSSTALALSSKSFGHSFHQLRGDLNPDEEVDEEEENMSPDERRMISKMEHAAELVKEICGYQHPETAEVFTQVALMDEELNRFERATEWIRHAFVITEKIFGVHHEATQDVYGILKVIESRTDDGLDQVPIEQMSAAIERKTLYLDSDDEDFDI